MFCRTLGVPNILGNKTAFTTLLEKINRGAEEKWSDQQNRLVASFLKTTVFKENVSTILYVRVWIRRGDVDHFRSDHWDDLIPNLFIPQAMYLPGSWIVILTIVQVDNCERYIYCATTFFLLSCFLKLIVQIRIKRLRQRKNINQITCSLNLAQKIIYDIILI